MIKKKRIKGYIEENSFVQWCQFIDCQENFINNDLVN